MAVKMCDKCAVNPATISFTKNINGKVTSMDVCEKCASEMGLLSDFASPFEGLFPEFSLASFSMPRLFGAESSMSSLLQGFGFLDDMWPGALQHRRAEVDVPIFDVPGTKNAPGNEKAELSELEKLQNSLKQAVDSENFERAAQIRDQIKKLRDNENSDK